MAGMQGFQLKVPQILTRLFETCWGWFEKMEPPDNVDNTVFTAYRLSLFYNIADTSMRAAGDNHQSLTRPEGQRRIVKDMILFDRSIRKDYFSHPRIGLLVLKVPFNLPKKNKVFGKMSRDRGGAHVKEP
jgi:hypothetical protein